MELTRGRTHGVATGRDARSSGAGKATTGRGVWARTTLEWWVFLLRLYWRILNEARIHKHTHKYTVTNIKFTLKLLQIKCHILWFIKDKAQNVLQMVIRVFAEAFVSHDRHTLFTL
jgi:hypothetical protein